MAKLDFSQASYSTSDQDMILSIPDELDDNSTLGDFSNQFTDPGNPADTDDDNPGTGDNTGDTKINKYVEFLKEAATEEGIDLPADLDFKDSKEMMDAFREFVRNPSVKKEIDNRFKDADPYVKKFLDVKEYFNTDVQALSVIENLRDIESLTDKDLEDENIQAAIYEDELITVKKLSKTEAAELVADAKALAKLDQLAKKSKENLKGFYETTISAFKENKAKQIEESNKKKETEFNSHLEYIDKIEDLGGFKLTEDQKKAIKKNMTTVVRKEDGKTFNDLAYKQHKYPVQINAVMEFLNSIGVFNVDAKGNPAPDFSKLSTLEKKKIERKLDGLINEGASTGSVGSTDSKGSLHNTLVELGYK